MPVIKTGMPAGKDYADAASSRYIGVMQLTDTLMAGGLERVAVNLANALAVEGCRSFLCATRREGALVDAVAPPVHRFCLDRTGRFDVPALRRLAAFVSENQVEILHAHGTSLFIAVLARHFGARCRILWHVHSGRFAAERGAFWPYRLAARRVSGVIAVNEPLAEWSRRRLRVPADRVWYIPNFVEEPPADLQPPDLPGKPGRRLVCVANLRPEKDHHNLLRAMRIVLKQVADAHLLLVGLPGPDAHMEALRREMTSDVLSGRVTWLGARNDVAAVLKGCDIGVLASCAEGLPLALLEYGMAGLPVVATRVGQCEEVLEDGRAGLLVPPSSPEDLGRAVLMLLTDPDRRADMGQRFSRRIREAYSMERAVRQVCRVYDTILGTNGVD